MEDETYPTIYSSNLIIPELIHTNSVLVTDTLIVEGDVEIRDGNLKITGQVNITGQAKVTKKFLLYGECTITKFCTAHHMVIQGPLTCPTLNAAVIEIKTKSFNVQNLVASKVVSFPYYKRAIRDSLTEIDAPQVILSYRGSYSKFFELPQKILSLFKKKKLNIKEIVLRQLKINADHLIIESFYLPESINFVFHESCDISVDKLEIRKREILPPPRPTKQ
jgi:cytoskeletal protein CcmA (bactofilin family)